MIQKGRLSATVRADSSRGIDVTELIRVFGEVPVALQERGRSEVERTTPVAVDSTVATLQAQVKQLQEQLQEARQREAWLQSIIEQRLLPPPPRQGLIERIAEAVARLKGPKGSTYR